MDLFQHHHRKDKTQYWESAFPINWQLLTIQQFPRIPTKYLQEEIEGPLVQPVTEFALYQEREVSLHVETSL